MMPKENVPYSAKHQPASTMTKNHLALVLVCILVLPVQTFNIAPAISSPSRSSIASLHSQVVSTVESPIFVAPPDGQGAISLTIDELGEKLGGRGRGRIAWDCYSAGIDPQLFFSGQEVTEDQATVQKLLPAPRRTQTLGKGALELLTEVNSGGSIEGGVATLTHVSRSRDSTTKLLLRLKDGFEVETVLIPWKGTRTTVCISSQVGCRQGCTFCATGRMGKLRSLSSDEILAQLFFAVQQCRREGLPPVSNVVFMGMGEPGDNVVNVKKAAQIMTTRELFQLSAQRVTISTVAPSPQTFMELADAPAVLAWSVHAARDELRRQLVPTTKYTMVELRQGLIDALLSRANRTTMLEIALMKGVNDSDREADELADFCREIMNQVPGCKLICNLIPFNDIGQERYEKPAMERVLGFQKRLQGQGICAHLRATRGDDESAACGQLATKKKASDQQREVVA
jgi:23S rRNA (adenine2503-C2)-methyltransferase